MNPATSPMAVLRLPIKSPTITNPVEIPDPRLELDGFDIEASDSIELNYRRSALGQTEKDRHRHSTAGQPATAEMVTDRSVGPIGRINRLQPLDSGRARNER
jgi:hypothetical protein